VQARGQEGRRARLADLVKDFDQFVDWFDRHIKKAGVSAPQT